MQEPIREVPKTRVRACTCPKIAAVMEKAKHTASKIEEKAAKIGRGVRKTKISMARTASRESVEIRLISKLAFVEDL